MTLRRVPVVRWLGIAVGTTTVLAGTLAAVGPDNVRNAPIGILRFGRAALTVSKIVADYKRSLYSSGISRDIPEYAFIKSQVHQRSAEKLLDLCCTNGGAFIKIGQHLGSLEYLLPSEYVHTLRVLHSKAPPSSLADVLAVVREELQAEPSTLFTSFSPLPVGAASLAQVHVATTPDGRQVAVKVQHSSVKQHAAIDIAGMELLVSLVSYIFPDFNFDWLVEETKINLPLELDFIHEGHNAEKVAIMFKHFAWLKIPSIDWSLSTSRVLTMEYCEGGQVNDPQYMAQHGISPQQVTERLGLLYSEMIFCRGYVHSDPHPGNVLVNKMAAGDAQIILLDHGLYASVSDSIRHSYSNLWLAILSVDVEGIRRYGRELGLGDLSGLFACMVTGRSWASITRGIDKGAADTQEREQVSQDAANMLTEIIAALGRVNRQVLLLLKTNDLLRGIEHSLNIGHCQQSFLTMSRCCVRSVYAHQLAQCSSASCRARCTLAELVKLARIDLFTGYLSCRAALHSVGVLFGRASLGGYWSAFISLPGVGGVVSVGAASGGLVRDVVLWCTRLVAGAVMAVFGASDPCCVAVRLDETGRLVAQDYGHKAEASS